MTQFTVRRHSRSDSVSSAAGSVAGVGSAGAVRKQCPLSGAPDAALPALSEEAGALVPGAPALPGDAASLERMRAELLALEGEAEARAAELRGRLATLRAWISESFGVDEEDAADHLGETMKDEGGDASVEVKRENSTSSMTAAVPPLRIRLVDERAKAGSGDASSPGAGGKGVGTAPRAGSAAGTGAKNLGRMMVMSKGPLGDGTLPRGAPAQQVPASVFWNSVEPYFRPVDEADLRALEDAGRVLDAAPFAIPALGAPYAQQWREAHGYDVVLRRAVAPGTSGTATPPATMSLRERLLAALLEERPAGVPEPSSSPMAVDDSSADASDSPAETPAELGLAAMAAVNAKIRETLGRTGAADLLPATDAREDDEVCAELRRLQRLLREQLCVNAYRRRRLAERVRAYLPAQEFYTLLADVDRQVEAAFARRLRILKKKKKGALALTGGAGGAQPAHVEPGALAETRRRLVDAFSGLLPSQREFLQPPVPAELFRREDEAAALQFARESGAWLRVPERPLAHVRLARCAALPVCPGAASSRADSPPPIVFELPTEIP